MGNISKYRKKQRENEGTALLMSDYYQSSMGWLRAAKYDAFALSWEILKIDIQCHEEFLVFLEKTKYFLP